MLNHWPKSKWPQLWFLTDLIGSIWLDWPLIPACQLDQKYVINFPIFSLPLSFAPCINYTIMILSAFISLYPKHTNVYKTVTRILSKSKWFVRSPEIRLRRSWLYIHWPNHCFTTAGVHTYISARPCSRCPNCLQVVDQKERFKEVAKRWKTISAMEKKKYEAKKEKAVKEYKKLLEKYKKVHFNCYYITNTVETRYKEIWYNKISDMTSCFLRSQWNNLLCFVLFLTTDITANKISWSQGSRYILSFPCTKIVP